MAMPTVLLILVTLATLAPLDAVAAQASKAPDPLTVVGAIPKSNRPAADATSDVFPDFHGKTAHRIFAFDWDALKALPQHRVRARKEDWPRSIAARGPRLRDAMDAAGVPRDAGIELIALDGYSLMMSSADRAARDWILAIEVDGQLLDFGARGPIWLLFDTGDGIAPAGAAAAWLRSLFMVQVPDWHRLPQ